MRPGAVRRARVIALLLLAAGLSAACSGSGVFTREYEYEEELYLALDGSATLNVNASVASLVALRGADLDPDPRAHVERARVRELFEGEGARASVSLARREGRRFVHVTVRVDDVRHLSRVAPFAWSSYRLDRGEDIVRFRQVVGPPARGTRTALGFTGGEMVAFRMHLPSEVRFHNAPSGEIRRGNILEWEQPLSDRLAGAPVNIEVHIAPESILYTTLVLFGSTVLAAAAAMALVIWWMARRGRGEASQPPRAPARERA